jgi:hypothetical protein
VDGGVGDLPRTLTGGLVDPMKTKLEMMVAYLAGRQGQATGSIRRELRDPTSEASRWLEALRSRSGGILGAAPLEMSDPLTARPIRDRTTAPGMAGRRLPSLILGASAAALVVLAVDAAWRSQDGRLRRLESTLARREAGWADRFDRLEAALARRQAPPPGEPPGAKAAKSRELQPPTPADWPTNLALARIEARLGELGQRLEEGQAGRDQDGERSAQIRRDLDRLRQEVELAVRASRQGDQELGAAVREILQLLRRLASQSGPMEMMPGSVPIPVSPPGHEPRGGPDPGMFPMPDPVPSPAQVPGGAHMQRAPGRSHR